MLLLTAGWLVPVCAPPIPRGRLAVEAGKIVWLGAADSPGQPQAPLKDLGPGVLMPGLVNAHGHLELAYLGGEPPQGGGYVSFVREVVGSRGRVSAAEEEAATQRAIDSLLASGTVAVGDVSNSLAHLEALAVSPLAAVVFHELIGWDPARAPELAGQAQERLEHVPVSLADRDVRVRLAAHAPHSVSPELFAELGRRGGVASLHLAESREEVDFLADGAGDWAGFLEERGLGEIAFRPAGASPVSHLADLGVLREGLVAAHCVQVDDADCRLLAQAGVRVALCPRSNERLGVGVAPVPLMRERGVSLCLGTDSLGSVDDLRLEGEMYALRHRFPELEAAEIVSWATAGGAVALGLEDLGDLAPGRRAALAYADVAKIPDDPLELLVSGEACIRGLDAEELGE